MLPLWSLSPGYSPALRHGSLVSDSSFQQLGVGMATRTEGLATAPAVTPQSLPMDTVIPGVSSVLQRDKVLMLLLTTDCHFPSAKQKESSNPFTGSRQAADPWARTLQLMKVLLVWGSLHHWGTGPMFFRLVEDCSHPSFDLLSIFINIFTSFLPCKFKFPDLRSL